MILAQGLLLTVSVLSFMDVYAKDPVMKLTFQGASMPLTLGPNMEDYVEIGLLLPKNRATALLELARDRHETVGQILRQIVDNALRDSSTS